MTAGTGGCASESFTTFAAATAPAVGTATSTLGLALAFGVEGTTESGSRFIVIGSFRAGPSLIVLRRLRISNKPINKMSRAAPTAMGIGFNWASRSQCSARSFERVQKSGRGCVEAVVEVAVGEAAAIADLAGEAEPNGAGVGDARADNVVTGAGVTPAFVEDPMALVRSAEFKFDWTAETELTRAALLLTFPGAPLRL